MQCNQARPLLRSGYPQLASPQPYLPLPHSQLSKYDSQYRILRDSLADELVIVLRACMQGFLGYDRGCGWRNESDVNEEYNMNSRFVHRSPADHPFEPGFIAPPPSPPLPPRIRW